MLKYWSQLRKWIARRGEQKSAKLQASTCASDGACLERSFEDTDACLDSPECDQREVLLSQGSLLSSGSEGYGSTMSLSVESGSSFELQPHLLQSANAESQCKAMLSLQDTETLCSDRFDTLSPAQSPLNSGQVSTCKYARSTTCNSGYSPFPEQPASLPGGFSSSLCLESDCSFKPQPRHPLPTNMDAAFESQHRVGQSLHDRGTVCNTSHSLSSVQPPPPSSREGIPCACGDYNSNGSPPPAPPILPPDACSCSSLGYDSGGSHEQLSIPPDLSEVPVGTFSSSDKPPPYSDHPVETMFYDTLSSSSCLLFGVEISEEVLGRGSYGVVHVATYVHQRVAAKSCHAILQPSQHIMRRFADECELLSRIKHPSIVQFLGVHMDPDTHEPYIVMELMEGGTLYQLIDSLPSPQPLFLHKKLEIVTDIALALVYLHEVHNVVHRDLSSTNVLLTKDLKAKISDLGVARPFHHYMHNEPTTVVPGCQLYMPPEALDGTFTKKSDVFSLGVLMVEVFGEHHPRPSIHHRRVDGDIFQRVSEVERRKHDIQLFEERLQDAQGQVAQGMIDLVYQCLESDPDDRPDTNDTISRLARLQRGEGDTSSQPNTAVHNSHQTHSTVEAPLPRKTFKQKPRPCRQHHAIPASSQTEGSAAVVHGGIVQPSFNFSEASVSEAIESEESAQATTENPSNESSHSTSELLVPTTESQNQTDGKSEMVTNYSSTPSHSSDSLHLHGTTLSPATVTEVSCTTVHTEEGKQVHTSMTTNDATQASVPENTVNYISESEETNDNLCTESDSLFDYSRLPFRADSKSADDDHHMAVVKHTCSNNNSSPSQGDLPVHSTLQVSEVSSRTSLTRTWTITYLCTSYPPGISQFILVLTTGTYSVIGVQTVLGSSSITVTALVPTSLVMQEVLARCATCLLLTLYLEYVCSRLSSCSLLPSSRPRHDGSILRTEPPSSFSLCFDELFVFAGKSFYSPFFKFDVHSRGVNTLSVQTLRKVFTCELSISPEEYHYMILFRNRNSIKEPFALSSTPLALGYQNAVLPPLRHTLPQTFYSDDSAFQLEHSQYKMPKMRMVLFPPAMFPCTRSLQDNVMLQRSSTAPSPLAVDSARSIILSDPTTLPLKPQLPVLIPPLIARSAFAIARLLLHAQRMQFEVAVKYLSPEESQDEKKISPYSSYRAVASDWQCHQRKRKCSTVSPSVFTLKQQPLCVNPCKERQLNPFAKPASFASFTENLPNQQMLPSALSPSNSLCSQLKLVHCELNSFPSNKGLIFLLYSKLPGHGFVSGAFVFSNSTIVPSCETITHLCLVHITCHSASSPEYGLGIVVKSKYIAPVTLLITLLPTRSLTKTIHSVSPFIPQATLVICSNRLLKAASILHEPMAMVPGKTTTHESTTLTSVPQLSSQTMQPIPASQRSTSLTFTNTSYGGGEVCTCNPHSSMADLVCATGKVAQIHVFTKPLQSLHSSGPVGAACMVLRTMQRAACYQRVIWCASNSLHFLKLAKSLSSQGTVVHGTLSPNQPEISACPVAIGQESQLTYQTAKSSSVQDTLFCLPTSKPSLLASHKNMQNITRPCTTTTTLGKEEEHQPHPQPLILGMNYETSTQIMTATSSSVANLPLYCQKVRLYSPPNLQHVPQETSYEHLPNMKADPQNPWTPKKSCSSGKLVPHVSQQYPQTFLALLKHIAAMLGVMFNVAAEFCCKCLLKGLEEFLLPCDFKPSTFGTGSVINPASKEFSYIIDSLHCLLTALHLTNSTLECNNMMQDANRNCRCMNNLHLRWFFSNVLKLHIPSHNRSIWKSSVRNTPPLECPFVPPGDLSNAIHRHNHNQLIRGVVTTHPVSACLLNSGITHPMIRYKLPNLTKQEQLPHASLSAKPHLTTNYQDTCALSLSACPARLKHHTDNNSLSHTSSKPDSLVRSCGKLVTLTPSTAQCPVQKHVHLSNHIDKNFHLCNHYETSTQIMTATSSSVVNLPLYHKNVPLYSPPNLQHIPQETSYELEDLLLNMKADLHNPWTPKKSCSSGKLIPHVSQQYPQTFLALLKHIAAMLGVMFNVAAEFCCKCLLKGLEEFLLPCDFKPSIFGTGSVINPASKEFSYIIESLHCLLTALHLTNSTLECNNMMQDANWNCRCMNNLHLRWFFSNVLKLHIPSHNRSIWKSSVRNTPPLECPFVPPGDLSNAIHRHSHNQLIRGVVTTHPVSACLLNSGITHPMIRYKLPNLTKQEQLPHASLSAKLHLTTNYQATCTLSLSACPAGLKHHTHNNFLSHMSSIPGSSVRSCEKLVTLTPSTAQCSVQEHAHLSNHIDKNFHLSNHYESSTQIMTSSSVANLPLSWQKVLLYSQPNLQHVPLETSYELEDLLPNMKADLYNPWMPKRSCSSGKLIPHDSQQYTQTILALLKLIATVLGDMLNVAAELCCKFLLKGLEEFLLFCDFKPSTFGTGSVINPASKEFSYIIEALHCLLTALHLTKSTLEYNNMMQDANRNRHCMNNLHLRWPFSNVLKLHIPSQNLSIWKSSVGNTLPLECPFVPPGDLSYAIHRHNHNQLIPRVVTTHPVSACLLNSGITHPMIRYKPPNLTKQEQLPHAGLLAKPHLTTNYQATCTLSLSACPAGLKHHTDNNSLSHTSSIPDSLVRSCGKLVTLTPSTAQYPIHKHVHMNTASPPSESIPTIRQERHIRQERLLDVANVIHGRGRNDHLHGKQRPTILEFPHPVYKLPLDMEDPLHKSPPVDLTAKGRIVSSPHSRDQKDSQKDGGSQGQGSGGSDGSPPSGGDRGGENGGGPPSSSGNGRRDDDNEKDRAPDRKKNDDNYEEVNEGDEEGEEDEVDAQTPHSGDWQSKRCTGPRQHSAHFFNGQELPLQQPQPDNRAERRVYDQGVGPMDHSLSESTPGRPPKSTYGTPRKKQESNQQEDNHNDADDALNPHISDGQSKQHRQELPSQQLKANDRVDGVLHHQTRDTATHTPSDNEDEKHPANAHRAKKEKPVNTLTLEGNAHGTLPASSHPYPTETANPHSTEPVDPSESNTSLSISSRRKPNPAVQQGCDSSNTAPNNPLHCEEPCSPDSSKNEGVAYHPTSSKNGKSSAGKAFQSQQSVSVDSLSLLDDPVPEPLQEGASNSKQNPQTTGSKTKHPSSHHQPQATASLPSSEVPSLQPPVVNGIQTTTQPPVADDELQNGQPEVAGSQDDENQALGETSLGVIHTEPHVQSDGIEDDHSSANLLPQDVPPDNHEPDDDSSTSAELLPTRSQSLSSDQSQDEHNLGITYDGCSNQSSVLESVCPEVDATQPVDQFVSNNTTQSVDTGQLYTDFVTNATVKPSTWSFPTSVQDLQYSQGAIYKPFSAAHSETTTHESCEYDDTSPEACNSCSCTPIQESLHVDIARLRQELLQHGIRLVYECQNVSGFPLLVYLKQCVRQGHNHLVANALLLIVKCFTICRCWDTSFFLDCDAVTVNVETCEVVVDVARCIEPGGDSTEHVIGKLGILIRQLLYENICSSQNTANGPTESLLRSVLAILNWYYSTKDLTIITERLVTELMQHKYK